MVLDDSFGMMEIIKIVQKPPRFPGTLEIVVKGNVATIFAPEKQAIRLARYVSRYYSCPIEQDLWAMVSAVIQAVTGDKRELPYLTPPPCLLIEYRNSYDFHIAVETGENDRRIVPKEVKP